MISMQEIVRTVADAICALRRDKESLLIAIDGRCASGKTTLAAQLQQIYRCPVIHMDHFFLRDAQRTEERLRTPGENIDHERFLEEVLLPLRENGTCVYRPYDCGVHQLSKPIAILKSDLYIVEGSYACHKALRDYYDLRVFLSVEPEEQLLRITSRDGDEKATVFRSKWIPLEEAYFAAFDVAAHCDLRFTTG